ncbi:MAG TPA: VanZ family protein [Acidobacteriaceae bacterium]|nr:VanZ family protein [Acidobacteriaceae bacterium]
MSSRAEVLVERQPSLASSPGPGNRGLWFWILAWIPAAIGVTVIAIESTSMLGAEHTSGWLRPYWTKFFGAVADEAWTMIHWRIRKGGHFVGYGMVGLLFFRSWYVTLRARIAASRAGYWWRATWLAIAATIIIATYDEMHQYFIPNRTGSPHDVLIDTCGCLVAQLILAAVYFARRERTN